MKKKQKLNFKGNLFEQIKVFRKFEKNMKKRNEEKSKRNQIPCDPFWNV